MKRKHLITKVFSLLLAMMMVAGMSATALAAEPSVSFDGGKLLVFAPGSVYTDSDLFGGFKGMMPGDTRSEKITIQNQTNDCDYIKVYLRAVPHDETGNPVSEKVLEELHHDERRGETSALAYMHDFLSQLSMTVKNGTEVLYDASPNVPGGLTENVYLGTLRKGGFLTLDVELKVPITMDNEYAERIGEVDWCFVAEGFDDPTPPSYDDAMHTVRKVWVDDGRDRPDSVTVQLLRNGKAYDAVELSQSNNWAYTWDRLDGTYNWSVVEADVPEDYEAAYATGGSTTTITNTKKAGPTDPTGPDAPDEPLDPVDLTVVKKWDDMGRHRPDAVTVTLYDGDTAVESVRLGDWNDWTYTWRDLDGRGNWQALETNIPKGYVPSYTYQNGVVTVTNTATLIQTGQRNWPIPVMGGLGLALIAYGVIVIRKKRKDEHA